MGETRARVVYKYLLPRPVVELALPAAGYIHLFGSDPETGCPAIWVEHDYQQTESRTFLIVGTGHPVEPNATHIASMIAGVFVWHLYERRTPAAASL